MALVVAPCGCSSLLVVARRPLGTRPLETSRGRANGCSRSLDGALGPDAILSSLREALAAAPVDRLGTRRRARGLVAGQRGRGDPSASLARSSPPGTLARRHDGRVRLAGHAPRAHASGSFASPGRACPGRWPSPRALRSERAVNDLFSDLPPGLPGLRSLARPPVIFYLAGRVPVRVEPNLEDLLAARGGEAWALVDAVQLSKEGT